MRFPVCLFFSLVFAAAAQPAPRVVCEEPVHAFGVVSSRTVIEHEFVLTNRGDLPLRIVDIHADCGCTTYDVNTDKVEPGASLALKANLSLAGRSGPQHKTIRVTTNDPARPVITLSLTGTVREDVEASPPFVLVRDVTPDAPTTASVTVRLYRSSDPPVSVVCSLAGIDTKLVPVEQGREYRLELTTTRELESGSQSGVLRVLTQDGSELISIPIYTYADQGIVVAPATLVLNASADSPQRTQLVVQARGAGPPMTIVRVTSPLPEISVTTRVLGARTALIVLDNIPVTPAIDGRAILVETNLPGAGVLQVPIRLREAP